MGGVGEMGRSRQDRSEGWEDGERASNGREGQPRVMDVAEEATNERGRLILSRLATLCDRCFEGAEVVFQCLCSVGFGALG